MRVARIEIRNFRSIPHLAVDLGGTAVFIGSNDVGKSTILDALRFALTRGWGRSDADLNDIKVVRGGGGPEDPDGTSIELRIEESVSGEWRLEDAGDPEPVACPDSNSGRRRLVLRTCWVRKRKGAAVEQVWELLDAADGSPGEGSARAVSIGRLLRCLPVFYLGAVRDPGRTPHWTPHDWRRSVDALELPVGLEDRAKDIFDSLVQRLQRGDKGLKAFENVLLFGSNPVVPPPASDGPDPGTVPEGIEPEVSEEQWVQAGALPIEQHMDWIERTFLPPHRKEELPPFDHQGQGKQSLQVNFLALELVRYLVAEVYAGEPNRYSSSRNRRRISIPRPCGHCGDISGRPGARRSSRPTRHTWSSMCRFATCASCGSAMMGNPVKWSSESDDLDHRIRRSGALAGA